MSKEARSAPPSPLRRIGVKTQLPEPTSISLEGLEVRLEALRPPTGDELVEELRELRYRSAMRVPRAFGELIGPDDEVNVDTLGYCEGQLVPFSVNEGLMLGPQHANSVPGLLEALQGKAVGTTVIVHLVIPPEHPVPHLRGKPIVFTVRINGASELLAAPVDSPDFLADAKRGDTVDAVLESLAQEWLDAQAYRARASALQQVLETLAARAQLTVGPELVDSELGKRWRRAEGQLLGRLTLPMDEQEQALAGWLDHPDLRREVEQTLRAGLVLRAVALQEKLLDAEGLRHTIDDLLNGLGVDPAPVRRAFRDVTDAQTKARALDAIVYLRASEFVWSKVKVTTG